ncbi:MAG: DUF308 domain-containing protein [Treponema sp.]|nr:DUF308 domain-containing protein [Treponema sp.]
MRKTNFMLGILLAVVGLLMIVAPDKCIKAAVVILGLEAIANGIFSLIKIRQLISDKDFQSAVLIRGIISIIIGLLAVILPLRFAAAMWTVMLYVLAAYLLLAALLELYAVAKLRNTGIERKQYVVEAIVSIICAVILFIIPQQAGMVIIRILGVVVLLVSLIYVLYEWRNRPIVIDNVEVVDDSSAPVTDKPAGEKTVENKND